MKKKFMALLLCGMTATFALTGCTQSGSSDALKVGMVTDTGTIDDKSFNEGTWTGIKRAEEELGIDSHYLKPNDATESEYLKEIQNHYDTGRQFIILPGFKFETAVYKAQAQYPDAKFVILDGQPATINENDETEYLTADNTVSIFFAEHESGFAAGIATAVELGTGEVGFIGGMEIPPVQKFNWGFQQGIAYANENLGTNITLKEENIIYQGTFDDVAAGTQIAASMYDKGVDAIFCAAGGVGVGAINEAIERTTKGEKAWIIGVDVDQYAHGQYDSNGNGEIDEEDASVILTSAVKRIDNAAFDMIEAELNGKFPGGQILVLDTASEGVGIPEENPNLSESTIKTVFDIKEEIKAGNITILDHNDGSLIK